MPPCAEARLALPIGHVAKMSQSVDLAVITKSRAAQGRSRCNWPPPAATESPPMPAVQIAPQRGHSLDEGPSALNPSDRAFWIGLSLVLLSLVSAFATYLILTGLTPITPRNEVVLTVLFVNVAADHRHDRAAGLADHGTDARLATPYARRAAAHPHRRAVLDHRRAADAAARHRRYHHLLALARWMVRHQHARHRAELARCRQRLPRRAWAGDPHRHRQHGARSRHGGRIHGRRSVAAAAPRHGAGRPARSALRLHHRRAMACR